MAGTPPLALSNIVDISVTVAPTAAAANTFNQGLIIGSSAVIPSYGTNSRLRQYTGTAGMVTDGFALTDPEYLAAQIYFSQTPAPQYVWIGRQDLTAISAMTIDVAGTGYAVGDTFSITQVGAAYGIGTVTAETGGIPSAISIAQQGTGYADAVGLATAAISPSTGTGLTVTITAIGESLLQAAAACRTASSTWYGLALTGSVLTDNLAVAEWADPLWANTRFYPVSTDSTVLNANADNIALQLQTLKLRVLGITATTQNGLYPNNIYASAGLMGVEMGRNTGLPGSFFTVAHKQIAGIAPEPLTQTQYSNIIAAGWNVYANFPSYQAIEPGFMSNGSPSYLWLNLAMLVSGMQNAEMAVLTANPAVAQTNAAEHLLIQAVNGACATAAGIGFLAGATWTGATITVGANVLTAGDPLPLGYLNQAAPYVTQSSADRAAGKAMPIISTITTAGAVQSLVIGVYTQL